MHKKCISILFISISLLACSGNKNKTTTNIVNSNIKEDLIAANRVLLKKDQQRIEGFVKRNNWNMKETQTGLWVEIIKQTNNIQAQKNLLITINYKVSLLDGTVCYSSDVLGAKTFKIGSDDVESGLEQGVLLCNKGTKARFIMPPHLAYGLPGDGNKIPARAIIIYELEVINISNP